MKKIINYILRGVLFILVVGSSIPTMAQFEGNAFTSTVGFANQDLKHNDKNTMISIGYSYHLKFCPNFNIALDYGIEAADKYREGTSFGAELDYSFFAGMWNGEVGYALGFGARYQYDRLFFTNNPTIKSHAIGPVARLRIAQTFIETGYLWGVNEVSLGLSEGKGTMNSFVLKVGVYIPLNENAINRKLKKLSIN
ncbi:MAG: hypothetical protein ACTTJH_06075 [Bacteroidales bacterium]